jgi:hypothetical protein
MSEFTLAVMASLIFVAAGEGTPETIGFLKVTFQRRSGASDEMTTLPIAGVAGPGVGVAVGAGVRPDGSGVGTAVGVAGAGVGVM